MDEMKGTVIVYSRISCKASLQAKNTLAALGLPYLDIQLDAFPKVEEQLIDLIGGAVETPQIFFNSIRVSGYRNLRRLVASTDAWLEIIEMLERGEEDESNAETASTTTNESSRTEEEERRASKDRSSSNDLLPEDYTKLMHLMKRANLIKDYSRGAAHRNSFKGEDFVNWIMREKQVKRSEALQLGQTLIDRHFGKQIGEKGVFSPDRFYLMNDDDPNAPLNVAISNLADQPLDVRVGEINERLCERRRYLNASYYLIGRHRYSLQSIYNGILRGNKTGVGMLWRPFGKNDPRRAWVVPDGNPLVHFAVNTYYATCPPIRTYSVEDLNYELGENARRFLEDEDQLWYACDFGHTQDACIEWISGIIQDGPAEGIVG
ncbi:DEP domain-containing protein [Aphelenchoides fujianensis]|nr:DEP domain-containing protein [Aphelenchoides fujianensis]